MGEDAVRETVASEPQRWLRLEGIDNIRDVGGLPLRAGGTTRSGLLLRSANLHHVTPADVAHLVDEVGLELVIDLRTPFEIERDGPTAVAAAGVETVALSIMSAWESALPETDDGADPLLRAYLGYLDDRTEYVVEAVRLLARPDAGPTLVHCAAGKDRTGVLVALVLDAVGVARDAVVADYALSAEHVEAMFRRWTTASGREMPADLTPHLPRAEVVATILDRLDADHGDGGQGAGGQGAGGQGAGGQGGAAGWLRANGLTDDALARLRAHLTGRRP